jgi:hypothetical protein
MSDIDFTAALACGQASPEIAAADRIYDPLIGSWHARVLDYGSDGSVRENRGEWHFARVLEGRAVQDVFITPPCSQRSESTPKLGNRYGTSIRFFHPMERRWHVLWVNPVSGALNHLVARVDGRRIVQEGRVGDGALIRWSFSDLTQSTARWTGERSTDDGVTWRLEVEFFLSRPPDDGLA